MSPRIRPTAFFPPALLAAGLAIPALPLPGAGGRPPAIESRMSYLDNGRIRLGVDLALGGAVTYLSRSGDTENLINSYDWGRQVQQAYYSGPKPFGKSHPSWPDWPWNPITTGDVYGNPGKVLEHRNDGKTLYVKSVPMQWALDNVPGDCVFEWWLTLSDHTVRVRSRLTNHRQDRTFYPAFDQELPAVYTNGKFHRLVTYDGTRPFTQDAVRQIRNDGPPWVYWTATEHWAALLNDAGWGLGMVHPGVFRFVGGFHGQPNTGGPKAASAGYLSPIRKEHLDHNAVYTLEYTLVLGTLEEIRAVALAQRPGDPYPNYRFQSDRQHWTYTRVTDTGFPIRGHLHLKPEQNDPQLESPESWFQAAEVPKLFIRAAYFRPGTPQRLTAELFWATAEHPDYSGERRAAFSVIPDGKVRTYEVDLQSNPAWRGIVTRLRFDPLSSGGPGDSIKLESISRKAE